MTLMKNPSNGPDRFKQTGAGRWLENYDKRHRRPRPGRPGKLDAPTVRALRVARESGSHGAVKELSLCWDISYAVATDAARRRTYKYVGDLGPVREVTPKERAHGNHAWLKDRRKA